MITRDWYNFVVNFLARIMKFHEAVSGAGVGGEDTHFNWSLCFWLYQLCDVVYLFFSVCIYFSESNIDR